VQPRRAHHDPGRTAWRLELIAHLTCDQGVDLAPIVLVVGQTLIDLRALEVWKAANDVVNSATVDDQADDIVDADARALDDSLPAADAGDSGEVTIIRSALHTAQYLTRFSLFLMLRPAGEEEKALL